MQLELQVDPESASKLGTFKPLASAREGRPRSHPLKIVWHDTADHALREAGQILTQTREAWRLERLAPGDEPWLPGQPPPLIAQAESLSALDGAASAPFAPVAAFEGRRTISVYRIDQALVTIAADRGMLRAVTEERPVARLLLDGEDRAVHAAALLIADAFPVAVPTASLPAQGIALATGQAPRPRRLGPPRLLDPDAPVADGLAHILGHLTDVMLHYAPLACQPDAGPDSAEVKRTEAGRIEAVHQMRVATRRALSAVSIFRPALPPGALEPLKAELKTLAKALSHTRDWDVFVTETAPAVAATLPADERLSRLIAAADRRRRDYRKALAAYLGGPAFRRLGIEQAWFAGARCWQTPPPPAEQAGDSPSGTAPPLSLRTFGPMVVRRRWKKLMKAGQDIENLDIPALHALRLRTKRARYAAEMFASLDDGKTTQRAIRRLAALQQALGVLNDGAVAAHLLEELGGPSGRHAYAVGLVVGSAAARAGATRPQINRAFEKLRKHA